MTYSSFNMDCSSSFGMFLNISSSLLSYMVIHKLNIAHVFDKCQYFVSNFAQKSNLLLEVIDCFVKYFIDYAFLLLFL